MPRALGESGPDGRYVVADPEHPTPVTSCETFLPDDSPLYFRRRPEAPDLQAPGGLEVDPVHETRLFRATVTGPSEQPSRSAHHAAREARGRRAHAVLVLDFRPMSWPSRQGADRAQRGQDRSSSARRPPSRLRDGHGPPPGVRAVRSPGGEPGGRDAAGQRG